MMRTGELSGVGNSHWSSDIIGIKLRYEPGLEMTPGNPQIGCKQRAG